MGELTFGTLAIAAVRSFQEFAHKQSRNDQVVFVFQKAPQTRWEVHPVPPRWLVSLPVWLLWWVLHLMV